MASIQSVGTVKYCESAVAVARLIMSLVLNRLLSSASTLSMNVSISDVKSDLFR